MTMTASTTLINRLQTAKQLCIINLLTFTLWDETTIFRYTNLPFTFKCGDYNYIPLGFSLGELKQGVGFDVDSVDLNILYDSSDTITLNESSITLAKAIRNDAFKNSVVEWKQVFLENWSWNCTDDDAMVIWAGKFKLQSATRILAQAKIASFTDIMTNKTPPNIYTSGCVNCTYGKACGLDEDNWKQSAIVLSGSTRNVLYMSNSAASSYFTNGFIQYTGGSNYGQYVAVHKHTYDSSTGIATLELSERLNSTPSAGDTFIVFPGCDHSYSTCGSRFGNSARFRGFPDVPDPNVSL